MSRFLEWGSVVGQIDHEQLLSVLDTMLRVLSINATSQSSSCAKYSTSFPLCKPHCGSQHMKREIDLDIYHPPTLGSCSTKGSWVTDMIKTLSPKLTGLHLKASI